MDENFELEVTFKLKYQAKPEDYFETHGEIGEETPYRMARIDAQNFYDDPELLLERFVSSDKSELTVAPVMRFED